MKNLLYSGENYADLELVAAYSRIIKDLKDEEVEETDEEETA